MKFAAPRGTHDIWGEQSRKLQHLERIAQSVFRRYNYGDMRTPTFEDAGLFTRSIGETTDIVEKEMYVFADRKGRKLALRPEGTASVVRAYLEHNLGQDLPVAKFSYAGSMFRYERPQAGRYREFLQIGAEYFGNASPTADAEIITVARDILAAVGLREIAVHINTLGCAACRPAFRKALVAYFAKHTDLCGDCRHRLERNPLRLLDCKVDSHKFGDLPKMTDHLCPSCADHHASVKSFLAAAECPYIEDPRLVRGLDYYTRTVFEVRSARVGAQDALAAGGRYDALVQELGGPATPGVGFALGSERVLMACEAHGSLASLERPECLFIAVTGPALTVPAVSLAARLRRGADGQRIVEGPFPDKSLKAQMKLADRLNARTVIVFGDEEYARGRVLVRDMTAQSQTEQEISAVM